MQNQFPKSRKMQFCSDLESYNRVIEDLKSMSEIDDVNKYQRRSKALEEKINEAKVKVEQFNIEEEHFNLEYSTYPQISTLEKEIKSYSDLYSCIIDYNDFKDKLLSGKNGNFNPDEIENNLGNYQKNCLKMCKLFDQNPAGSKMISAVIFSKSL